LMFLPDVPLPDDLAWATANATLASAWARFAHEVERHGRAALQDETRRWACDYIHDRCGMGQRQRNGSLERAVESLPSNQRSAGRLVLLTALEPHRVEEKTVRDFAGPRDDPARLLGAISWASFTAARRIGARLDHQCLHERVGGTEPDGLIVSC